MAEKETKDKKTQAFLLFAKGETPSSPSVKALGLKSNTRWSYHTQWKKLGMPGLSEIVSEPELIPRGKPRSEMEMLVPVVEPEEEEQPETQEPQAEDETPEGEPREDQEEKETPETEGKKYRGPDGKKQIPTMIAGQGQTFAVSLSTKTLALYQISASMQEEELTLGDFLDACVEDTYRGRGLDLGLVKIGGKKADG